MIFTWARVKFCQFQKVLHYQPKALFAATALAKDFSGWTSVKEVLFKSYKLKTMQNADF